MPDLAVIVLALSFWLRSHLVTILVVQQRGSTKSGLDGQLPISAPLALADERSKPADAGDEYAGLVLALVTDRPNEVYLFGPAAELDEYGATSGSAPASYVTLPLDSAPDEFVLDPHLWGAAVGFAGSRRAESRGVR